MSVQGRGPNGTEPINFGDVSNTPSPEKLPSIFLFNSREMIDSCIAKFNQEILFDSLLVESKDTHELVLRDNWKPVQADAGIFTFQLAHNDVEINY